MHFLSAPGGTERLVKYSCSDRYIIKEPGRTTEISNLTTFWCRKKSKKDTRRAKEIFEKKREAASGDGDDCGGSPLCIPKCCGPDEIFDVDRWRCARPVGDAVTVAASLLWKRPKLYSNAYPHDEEFVPESEDDVGFAFNRFDAMENRECPGNSVPLHGQVG
jgi:hypothetical protein